MKRLIYITAATLALFACNGSTQDNDPWGKIDDEAAQAAAEEQAKQGKVLELSMSSSGQGGSGLHIHNRGEDRGKDTLWFHHIHAEAK